MRTNSVLKKIVAYCLCCLLLAVLSLPGLAWADNYIGKTAYEVVETRRGEEHQERLKKARKKMEREAKTPAVFLGDVIDVKVKELPGQVQISIITSSPLLFESSQGTNGEEINFLTLDIPFIRLEWTEGKQKTIEVEHGGVKDITLTEVYQPDFKVEVKVKLLPKASYNVYQAIDAKGIVIEVKEAVAEELKEASAEEGVEELPPVQVNIDVVDAEIQQVLKTLSEQSGLNIVTHSKVRGEVTAHLKNVPVERALDIILGVNGLAYRKVDNTILVGPEEQIAKKMTTSEVVKLEYIDAEAAKDMLIGIIEERQLQVNVETNSVIITAVPDKLDEVKKIIKEVDKPVPQVQLNAKVIEIGLDAAKELGIDWSRGIGVTFREEKRDITFPVTGAITLDQPALEIYQLARTAFEAKLNALAEKGHARILSNPRVVTMKDKEATIFIGDRIPYTVTNVAGGVATTEVRFIEPGIRLNITPKIINDNFVVMDIAPEVSYIYSFRGPQDEYPWVKTREAKASVRIDNGKTLVLGGLLSKEDKEVITKVPVLSSIPVLGEAFKNTKLVDSDTELLIVVTPTIIK